MALSSEVLISSNLSTPAGYTLPVAALTLTDPASEAVTLTVATSTVEDADPVVGITALVAAVKTAIDATDLPALGVDLTLTIEAQYTINSVTRDHGASIYSTTDNLIVGASIRWVKL